MSALRLVMPGASMPLCEQSSVKRLRGRIAAMRRPLLVTSQDAAVEFQEWCETVAVSNDRCLVRMERSFPRGTQLRLDIPNMKKQEIRLPGGQCVCQWDCTPRSLAARATRSSAIHGEAGYWVVELQFHTV